MPKGKINLSPDRVKRNLPPPDEDEQPVKPASVSAGPVDKIVDIVFNASDDKIREVTVIDRTQGRLLPQLDILNTMWQYLIQVATWRKDPDEFLKLYKPLKHPVPPNLHDIFIKRTAQWQKSIGGTNLKSAIDMALAEIESKQLDFGDDDLAKDPWAEK